MNDELKVKAAPMHPQATKWLTLNLKSEILIV